jgi:hypothetical protein
MLREQAEAGIVAVLELRQAFPGVEGLQTTVYCFADAAGGAPTFPSESIAGSVTARRAVAPPGLPQSVWAETTDTTSWTNALSRSVWSAITIQRTTCGLRWRPTS